MQAIDARKTADLVEVNVEVIYADNNAVEQSVRLARIVQSSTEERPSAIIVEPVGTGMVQVAKRAIAVGVGWVILNREVDYIPDLRRQSSLAFGVSTDHQEIGRIQGRQIAALLPNGGIVLCIEGPGDAAQKRTKGMRATLPPNFQVRTVRGEWTEESACRSATAWLSLSVSQGASRRADRGPGRFDGDGREKSHSRKSSSWRARTLASSSVSGLRWITRNRPALGGHGRARRHGYQPLQRGPRGSTDGRGSSSRKAGPGMYIHRTEFLSLVGEFVTQSCLRLENFVPNEEERATPCPGSRLALSIFPEQLGPRAGGMPFLTRCQARRDTSCQGRASILQW